MNAIIGCLIVLVIMFEGDMIMQAIDRNTRAVYLNTAAMEVCQ